MLNVPGTEVLVFAVHASYAGWKKEVKTGVPVLMVRRKNVKRTDYVGLFSADTKAIEKVPVQKADGQPADAVGVKITLKNGTVFHALVNYESEGTQVKLGSLKTKERFATDYK